MIKSGELISAKDSNLLSGQHMILLKKFPFPHYHSLPRATLWIVCTRFDRSGRILRGLNAQSSIDFYDWTIVGPYKSSQVSLFNCGWEVHIPVIKKIINSNTSTLKHAVGTGEQADVWAAWQKDHPNLTKDGFFHCWRWFWMSLPTKQLLLLPCTNVSPACTLFPAI